MFVNFVLSCDIISNGYICNSQMHFILLNLHYYEGEILQELTSTDE